MRTPLTFQVTSFMAPVLVAEGARALHPEHYFPAARGLFACYVWDPMRPSFAFLGLTLLTSACSFGLSAIGCSSSDATPNDAAVDTGRPPLVPERWHDDCDPLVPYACGFPFPTNHYLKDDPTSPTKKRVNFTGNMLPPHGGVNTDPSTWNVLDGFSPTGNLMTVLPYADVKGLPGHENIDVSLKNDSPTIVMEAETGALVPHWAEVDHGADSQARRFSEPSPQQTFLIRPAVRLKNNTRYIVAIRKVVDLDGQVIAPSAEFKNLRDGTPSTKPSVEGRRTLYKDIFGKLQKAGVGQADLQIAWDFNTASREGITGALVKMRDEALKALGDAGPDYEILKVEENPNKWIAKRILVKMKGIPLFLDSMARTKGTTAKDGRWVLGPDGLPKQNGTTEWEVLVHIPNSAKVSPKPLLQNGHGLFGSMYEAQNGHLAQQADEFGFVAFSVDLAGMCGTDVSTVQDKLIGDIGGFKQFSIERQHQGIINSLVAMRLMMGKFVKEPIIQFDGKSAIDPTQRYYRGDSQGGIFGTTYMAMTTDVLRGVVGEPGGPYSLLLNRSVDFNPFFFLLGTVYQTMYDLQIGLGLIQMWWDHTEPGGYVDAVNDNPLPCAGCAGGLTPKHEILLHVAIGDHQVTPLGAHYLARSVKAKLVDPFNRKVWGLEPQVAPFTGSALVEFDFGLPPAPIENIPMDKGEDPHDSVRVLKAAMSQESEFLKNGNIKQFCAGPCNPE